MAGDDDSEKNYDATPKKLEDARKKGEIPKSIDLNTAASYAGFILALTMLGAAGTLDLVAGLSTLIRDADHLAQVMVDGGGPFIFGSTAQAVAAPILTVFGLPALLVLAALFAQRAVHIAPEKIQPKLSRISPISGLKNKFGASGQFEFAKSAIKLAIISVLLVWFIFGRLDELITTTSMTPGQLSQSMAGILLDFLGVVFALTLLIGGIDYLWQTADHLKKNRMSFKEIKDEAKDAEGDPHFKQIRRQRGYDIAMNQMLSDVPRANVVIVNPTHYAVALQWDKASGRAPVCLAKGVDEIAARIREIAGDSNIAIFSDPPTARALHATVKIGAEIERDHYRAVAAAIRFAEEMRKKARS